MIRLLILTIILSSMLHAAPESLDFSTGPDSGVKVLKSYSGKPDQEGIFENYTLKLPDYTHGTYYGSPWWPSGGNRGRPFSFNKLSDLRAKGAEFGEKNGQLRIAEGGFFTLLKLADGDSLALLPIAGNTAYSWFDITPSGDSLTLHLGHWGTDNIDKEDVPVIAWARGSNPYEAAAKVWQKALECAPIKGNFKLREEKTYPEIFNWLGWCSWEFYRGSHEAKDYPPFSETGILELMADFVKLGKPVRWMLLDNGHFNSSSDFSPKEKSWPNGYRALKQACSEDGIRWIGIWYAFMGGGKHPYVGMDSMPPEVQKHMSNINGAHLPKPTLKDSRAFYEYLYSFAKKDDLDFLKIDFSTRPIGHYAGRKTIDIDGGRLSSVRDGGIANPYKAHALMFQAFEEVSDEQFNGMINCNWHLAPNLFHLKNSVVGRCSEDYKPGKLVRGKTHHFYSYAAMPWMGQVAWGDHDMFHSGDKKYGRLMAASKALSGAPVYISDGPKECDMTAIAPLCYADGKIIRPLAPGAPIYDDVFFQLNQGEAFRVMAPLKNKIAVFSGTNIESKPTTVTATFTPAMYTQASGLIQPYPGEWKVPKEGLVYYDIYAQKGGEFDKPLHFELTEFTDCLLQVSPIENGWSLIGRTDKYLCGAAVDILENSTAKLVIRLPEKGPVAIYSTSGTPQLEGVEFKDLGNNIYQANLPQGEVTLNR